MFPPLRVRLSGLDDVGDADCNYDVILDILSVDSRRYRYAYHRSSWVVSDRAPVDDTETPARTELMRSYRHPDGPFRANQLMQRPVSFDRVKLTNNRCINGNGYVSGWINSKLIMQRLIWSFMTPILAFHYLVYFQVFCVQYKLFDLKCFQAK